MMKETDGDKPDYINKWPNYTLLFYFSFGERHRLCFSLITQTCLEYVHLAKSLIYTALVGHLDLGRRTYHDQVFGLVFLRED